MKKKKRTGNNDGIREYKQIAFVIVAESSIDFGHSTFAFSRTEMYHKSPTAVFDDEQHASVYNCCFVCVCVGNMSAPRCFVVTAFLSHSNQINVEFLCCELIALNIL